MTHRPHEKLKVWQESIDLTVNIYEITRKFPKEEIYVLASQMKRAAVSIASNIAEGSARRSRKEFIQYLYQSRGSLSELETQIIISLRLKFISSDNGKRLLQKTDSIGKMLTGLIASLGGTHE